MAWITIQMLSIAKRRWQIQDEINL